MLYRTNVAALLFCIVCVGLANCGSAAPLVLVAARR